MKRSLFQTQKFKSFSKLIAISNFEENVFHSEKAVKTL